MLKTLSRLTVAALIAVGAARAQSSTSVLFIGNSFTFGDKAAVHFYRANTVTDLNHEGIGGVPALFKTFTGEAGLRYDVSLETHPGVGLDWHLAHERDVLTQRPWDVVVMHGYSTLDSAKPGDPATLVASAREMADLLRQKNPNVALHLEATWPRADQTYVPAGHWAGQPIEAMARDVRAGYDKAAEAAHVPSVIPVGGAWLRAFHTGVADANPYDGLDAGKVDLWAYDHYHGSTYGYYLSALVIFGNVTGRDPRSLTERECAAFELGLSPAQAKALQQVAFDELTDAHVPMTAAAAGTSSSATTPIAGCAPSAPPVPAAAPAQSRAVNPPGIAPLVPVYSVAVRAGEQVFVSGMTGVKPGTQEIVAGGVDAQTRQALENIRTSLQSAGATMTDVVECTVFLMDMADYAAMNKVYVEFFPVDPPARAAVAVAALPRPAARVEIKCSAVIGRR